MMEIYLVWHYSKNHPTLVGVCTENDKNYVREDLKINLKDEGGQILLQSIPLGDYYLDGLFCLEECE